MNRKKLQKLTDTLTKNCKHFDKFEVKCLITLFYNLVGDVAERPGVVTGLDRNVFRNILHVTFGMTDDMIMDRVFRGFDKDNDGCISVSEWIHGLSLFLRGTLDEKMKYCFEVFDLNGDGFISKEEMFHMLKNSLLKQPSEEDPDEGIKDLVEITLKKMDHDHDGKLSFVDYEKAVREENLLLEAFGPCLPDPKCQSSLVAWMSKHKSQSPVKQRYMKAYPALFSAVSCGLTQRRWSVFAEEQSRAGLDPEAYQDGKDHSISDLS